MFAGCESLSSFPGISEWNIGKVRDMKDMFKGCKKLKKIPGKFKKACIIF